MNIVKNMIHIWIGPNPAPKKWMNTWTDKHPDWRYRIFDNKELKSRNFRNRHLIDEYMKRRIYAGAADLIRYEILYDEGGFIPEADSICYENIDELFDQNFDYCYTCYENEKHRGNLVSPIMAANSGNEFLKIIIEELNKVNPKTLSNKPWESTGNKWLGGMIEKHSPRIKIFPSHYFIPNHYDRKVPKYSGKDKIYANQMWGSTNQGTNYKEGV